MTLHCVAPSGVAVACGIPSQPLSVAPIQGGSTSANQAAEIGVQQSLYQVLGTQGDAVYAGGPGSVVALLKGIFGEWATGQGATGIAGGALVSRSGTVAAAMSSTLFPANPARRYLAFQAPQGTSIWVNFAGGAAAPGAPDCAYFSAGSFYESGPFVNRGAITVYAPVSTAVSAWEN
jgi:hypothetical protein